MERSVLHELVAEAAYAAEQQTREQGSFSGAMLSPGLELRDRETGIVHQVVQVDKKAAIIASPEGEQKKIAIKDLINRFVID